MAIAQETTLPVSPGSGTNVAGYTDINGNFRQVVAIGDPYYNYALMPVGVQLHSDGGNQTSAAVTSGKNTVTVISTTPSFLCRVLITTANSGVVTIYDNASAASGTVIGYIPASAAIGTVYNFQLPALNGITVSASSNNPALTISFVNQTIADVS